MEHHFIHKITSLFPSSLITSCQSKCVPDVTQNSISTPNHLHKSNYSLNKTHKTNASKNQSQPPDSKMKISFSSNSGGWFTTASDKENSSESFRLKEAEKSFRRTRFDDLGRCSSTISSNSANTHLKNAAKKCATNSIVPSKNGYYFDFIEPLTELYYSGCSKNGDSRKARRCRRRRRKRSLTEVKDDGLIEESIAVEKRSSDPHGDFWKSMVEMITVKSIFGVEDLYKLLECFLSLNSPNYHKIILEVFIDICNNLFN